MKIKVLVVEDDLLLAGTMEKYFNRSGSLEVIKVLNNGEEAIDLLKSNIDFDVMILDIVMPKKDGIAVLDYVKENKLDKKIIVASSFGSEEIIRKVSKYGVKYFVLKPFDLNDLTQKIIEVGNNMKNKNELELQNKDMQMKVTNILHNLGIPSNIKGYQYIRTAILMVYEDPSFIGGITKQLYPNLSEKFNTTNQRVERSIRHAIEVSWLRGDIDLMDEIFGHSVDIDKAKPTNSEFIVTIADKLRLETIK